jgi:hypothetical protein
MSTFRLLLIHTNTLTIRCDVTAEAVIITVKLHSLLAIGGCDCCWSRLGTLGIVVAGTVTAFRVNAGEIDFSVEVAISDEVVLLRFEAIGQFEVVILCLLKVEIEEEDGVFVPSGKDGCTATGADERGVLSIECLAKFLYGFEPFSCFAAICEGGSECMYKMTRLTWLGVGKIVKKIERCARWRSRIVECRCRCCCMFIAYL